MWQLLRIFPVAFAILASMAYAQGKDTDFVQKAAQDGMAEVEIGKMVMQRAQDAQVKQFAEQMVNDHTKANQQLMQIAQQKKWTVPKNVNKEQQAMMTKLEKLSGAELDRHYMEDMVKDHEKAVELFSKQAEQGSDPELKQFAADTLPTLRQHLAKAQEIAKAQLSQR